MSARKILSILALSLGACVSNAGVDSPGAPAGRPPVTATGGGAAAAFNPATWTPNQQVFTLSMLSNQAANQQGSVQSLESLLAGQIGNALSNPGLQNLIGTWTVAWGPVVFQESGSQVADNAMYVAKDQAGDTYVVAIAGTNPVSIYDLKTEDADVGTPVDWPYGGVPGGTFPEISPGTQDGVNALLGMMDPAQGKSLQSFLQQIESTSTTLVFTGHSLGGALAPTLALALFNGSGALQVSDFQSVLVYPTAGPTPGNADFVTFFSGVFPASGSGVQAWNSLIWNSLDAVPHAWSTATLAELPAMYGNQLPASQCIQGIAGLLGLEVVNDDYTQVPNQGALAGTYQTTLPPSYPPPSGQYATSTQFAEQAFYQHIEGYYDLLGVDQLLPASGSNPNGLGIFQVPAPPAAIGDIISYVCQKVGDQQAARGGAR